MIGADEALRHGIVNRVVQAERFDEAVLELAAEVAAQAPLAVQATKRLLLDAQQSLLEPAMARETEAGADSSRPRTSGRASLRSARSAARSFAAGDRRVALAYDARRYAQERDQTYVRLPIRRLQHLVRQELSRACLRRGGGR